jgi:heme/copper-type cytochrome/quinol oxidase subunit 2
MAFSILKQWSQGLIFVALALLILFLPLPLPTPVPTARTIRIEASQYQFSPGEIQVNPGDQVTIELVSTDVMHGLSLDGYNLNLTAQPGQPARGTFVAEKAGVLRFRCSIPCGNMHPFMIGKLQIVPDLLLYRAIVLGLLAILAAVWSLKTARQAATERNPQPVLGEAD